MGLSNCQKGHKIPCLIRKELVVASPEERVRQQLLHQMIHHLGFPFAYLSIEKALCQIPHLALKDCTIPNRRMDLVCFCKGIHPKQELYPLLVVECKAIKLTKDSISQVIGYNHFIQAYFIALANGKEIKTGWYDPIKKGYTFIDFLPSYSSLLKALK